MAIVDAVKLESQLRLGKAKMAAQQGDLTLQPVNQPVSKKQSENRHMAAQHLKFKACPLGLIFMVGWLLALSSLSAGEVQKITLPPAADMERAELYVWQGNGKPKAALVLSPGYNQSGEPLVRNAQWQQFAKNNRLALVGLSFASEPQLFRQGRGYYYASQGSGETLLAGIRQAFGGDLPLLLYGFSGGAHFTSRFVEWKPEQVLAWCAYSAAWWDEPKASLTMPPGIVACGQNDERLGASMLYFKQGRAAGKPWLWIEVANTGHQPNAGLDDFARNYFAVIISHPQRLNPEQNGVWLDIDRLAIIPKNSEHPTLTGWLPERKLFKAWQSLSR